MQPRGSDPERAPTFTEAARRTQIVAASIRAIAEHGFAGASFARIAAQAGISPGLITYHFRTKDQLIEAVLTHLHSSFDAAMSEGPEPAGHVEALTTLVTGYVRHCRDHPDEATAMQEITAGAESSRLRTLVLEIGGARDAELVEFLVEGQREGEFRSFDADVTAAAILAILGSVPRRLRREGASAEREGRELAALVVHAVRPTAGTDDGPGPPARAD